MLLPEARYFEARLRGYADAELFPLLNVGSGNEEFRKHGQPWIDRLLLAPLRRRANGAGGVTHLDIQDKPGVDMVGDLMDCSFREKLTALRFKAAFCMNLLEHVTEPAAVARSLHEVLPEGGLLFVSVPHRFPYHPDPIDTLYRPEPEELVALFEGFVPLDARVVPAGTLLGYFFDLLRHEPQAAWAALARRAPGSGSTTDTGADAMPVIPWLLKPLSMSCVVLRKQSPAAGRDALTRDPLPTGDRHVQPPDTNAHRGD